MRKLLLTAAALSLGAASFAALAQKPEAKSDVGVATVPGKGAAARISRITASVEAIDAASRTVTLKGPRGRVVDIVAGPEVKNFDQIKVGDFLVVRYIEALTLELKKGGSGVRERSEKQDGVRAAPGERPGAAGARQVTVVANVVALNKKTQTVTLKGPKRTVDLKLRDPKQFERVKVGDQVEATYTEAAAISVEPAPKPAAEKKK